MNDEAHIASLIVYAHPQSIDTVGAELIQLAGLEIHAADPDGKFIVTLETDSEAAIIAIIDRIQRLVGVLGANLVYHHSESVQSLEETMQYENHAS